MKDMCMVCERPRSEHEASSACPPYTTYFTPCKHERTQGSMAVGMDGVRWSDITCMDCYERFVTGTPP